MKIFNKNIDIIMEDLVIRRYLPGDEKGIINLFQQVFKKPMGITESISHWNWEYKNNPIGRLEIFLAIHRKKIISHYAVIPIEMKIQNQTYVTSLSLDTMTHNNYRGKGIFPLLAKKLYKQLGESGIPLTFGFPNKYSINGFIHKLNWIKISNVPIYILPLNFKPLINRYLRNSFLACLLGRILNYLYNLFLKKKRKDPEIIRIKEFDSNFDKLWNFVKDEIIVGVVRNQQYLSWRYFEKPEENYICFGIQKRNFLEGYIILKIEKRFGLRVGLIMDLLTHPSNTPCQQKLINHAIFFFKSKNVDIISLIMFPHWPFYKLIKSNRFIKIIKKIFPEQIYFGARLNSDNLNREIIKNPKNWYLTWGDTDVV